MIVDKKLVMSTDAFKSLSKVQQLILSKYRNIKKIEHAVTVIKNIGYDNWRILSNETNANLSIIKELTNNL